MSILDTYSGRIRANWTVEGGHLPHAFAIVAPYNDGPPGKVVLGGFSYRPHAELAAKAPAMAEAMEKFCKRVEAGEVRSRRTYAEFNEILGREPQS